MYLAPVARRPSAVMPKLQVSLRSYHRQRCGDLSSRPRARLRKKDVVCPPSMPRAFKLGDDDFDWRDKYRGLEVHDQARAHHKRDRPN